MELVIVVGAAIVGLFAAIARASNRKADRAWSEAAQRLGLEHETAALLRPRRIAGSRGGFGLRIQEETRRGGKPATRHTRYEVAFPEPLGSAGLRIARPGLRSAIDGLLGAQRVRVGDRAFDDAVSVNALDPRAAIAYLTPERRAEIQRLLAALPQAQLEDERISLVTDGVELDPDKVAWTLRMLVASAARLAADAEPGIGPVPAAAAGAEPAIATTTGPSPLAAATEVLRPATTTATEAGAPPSAGPRTEPPAAAATRPAPRPGPPLPGPSADAPPTSSPALPEAPSVDGDPAASEAAPARPDPEGVADEPPIETVYRDLFGGPAATLAATGTFDDAYSGAAVHWTGTLEAVDRAAYDFPFGIETGDRAVFVLRKGEGGLLGRRELRAVVRVSTADADAAEGRVGRTVSFRGVLVACDPFGVRLFVADGAIDAPESGA